MNARPPQVPGYVLGARLGGGATCDVYSASDHLGQGGWAVKVLRDDAARDPTNIQLLRREARVGRIVHHPHLVRVVGAVSERARPFHLVMERARGRSLRVEMREAGRLDATRASCIVRQAAAALAALHRAGYLHGDVKPDNLHVAGRQVTLLDLGFAHKPGDDGPLLGDGYVLGTANYVAPELCDESGRDGPAADVFSLGVTLFELLTGRLPYPEGDVEETMLRHRDVEPASLRKWQGGWPSGLVSLADRMLLRDPERRPTASEVMRALTAVASRGP